MPTDVPVPSSTGGPEKRPVEWTGRLGRALRGEGLSCTLTESIAALEAIRHLDLADPIEAYLGLKCVFVSELAEEPLFDRVFWAMWEGREVGDPDASSVELLGGDQPSKEGHRKPTFSRPDEPVRRPSPEKNGSGVPQDPVTAPAADAETTESEAAEGRDEGSDATGNRSAFPLGSAWSPAERLARRSFALLDEEELRRLDREFDRLLVRLSTRKSRRLRPHRRRGVVDLRRSFRRALELDGELLRLARRSRRIDRPRLVLLCDVSGSMGRYSRFLIRFLLATRRTREVETFVFSTRLVRLTPWLSGARPEEALAALGERVPGWSGGTRIGASLEAFVEGWGRKLLGQRTVVVVLSDGLDQGETEPLVRAMEQIRRQARKVIWLNPLLESPEYRPEARGMKAALPYVDDFASGHSFAALRRLADLIRL